MCGVGILSLLNKGSEERAVVEGKWEEELR